MASTVVRRREGQCVQLDCRYAVSAHFEAEYSAQQSSVTAAHPAVCGYRVLLDKVHNLPELVSEGYAVLGVAEYEYGVSTAVFAQRRGRVVLPVDVAPAR